MKATRDGFGEALVEIGRSNKDIVVLSGDLEDSTRAEYFKKEFPERFFNLGIAEQDIIGTAAGLTETGFIPFACSFAAFITTNAYGVLRITVCYNNRNVKIAGSHGGITVGPDGATAQALEDFAVMRALPNMTVICPADAIEAKKSAYAAAKIRGPVYLRLGRTAVASVTKESDPFTVGRANVLKDGSDITIIACGLMVQESLKAAGALSAEGVEARVVNMHTIKPIDRETIVKAARDTGAVVTAEEHQISGGLGSAVAEVLSRDCPVPMEIVGIDDAFGESGDPEALLNKYHLKAADIAEASKKVILRKGR